MISVVRTFMVGLTCASFSFGGFAKGQEAAPEPLKTSGPVSAPSVLYSPNRQYFAAWVDIDALLPIGAICPMVFRNSKDGEDIFSVVVPQDSTKIAAWNAGGTGCLLTDQPDNGTAFAWLIYRPAPQDKWRWRKIDFLAPLYAGYRRALLHDDKPLFRPYLDQVEWISDTQIRFLVWSNLSNPELASSGRYYVTVNTQALDAEPKVKKFAAD